MSEEHFIAYWNGEEPTPPSPTLDMIPDYVNVVVLFWASINPDGSLNFSSLVKHNSKDTIKGWMQEIRRRQAALGLARPTRFTLGILGTEIETQDPGRFSLTVKAAFDDWGLDGITIDYEPPSDDQGRLDVVIEVVQSIRCMIGTQALMTAPIYDPWLSSPASDVLPSYAAAFDYIETMDYSPYVGSWDVDSTEKQYEKYATAIGPHGQPAYEKVAIGVSCMDWANGNHTPLADVISFCTYEPKNGKKAGIMLYSSSYDAPGHDSYPYPYPWKYAKAIHDNLP